MKYDLLSLEASAFDEMIDNDVISEQENRNFSVIFERCVDLFPNEIAVSYGDLTLTYNELNDASNQLARTIMEQYSEAYCKPIESGIAVSLYLEKNIDIIISILAVFKLDACYVPISTDYPVEHSKFIIENSCSSIVITQKHHVKTINDLVNKSSRQPFCLSINEPSIKLKSTSNLNHYFPSDSAAYILYTSGTTGKPKGVIVEHAAFIQTARNCLNLLSNTIINSLSISQYTFDIFGLEYALPLITGGCIALTVSERSIQDLTSNLPRINFIQQTPSMWKYLLSVGLDNINLSHIDIFVGGESGTNELFNTLSKQFQTVYQVYGPTETCIWSTFSLFNGHNERNIGYAFPTEKVYILDAQLELVPSGTIGELYISGSCLARSYISLPEVTARSFINNHLKNDDSRLYKTGDLGFMLPDGSIEFIGRVDGQVKIRGFRVELGEVETALLGLDGIKQAVVIDREREGAKYLAAYVVLAADSANGHSLDTHHLDREGLIASLTQVLPEYMVPATFIKIEAIPLTINGKLDRRALPEPDWVSADNYTAPRNELETQLCEIWQSILGLERIGIHDNFFRSGGDSIISIQLVSKLRRAGFSLQVKVIFDAPTVAQLAHELEKEAPSVEIIAEQGRLEGEFGLLPIQEWFFNKPWASEHHWNQAFMVQLPKGITLLAIEQALQDLAEQHDILRTRFTSSRQAPALQIRGQRYDDNSTMAPLVSCDVSALSDEELHQQLTIWQSDFALDSGPLWQAAQLTGYEDGRSRIFFAFHHLIIDAVSWRIIADDMRQLLTGEGLSAKTSSYRQWVGAIADYGNAAEKDVAYWQGVTTSMPPLSEFIQPQVQGIMLSSELTGILLHKANGGYYTEINDLLLSALTIALQGTFGEGVNHITIEGHGRELIDETLDVSQTVGWFTSMYPVKLNAYETVAETIIYTKEMLRAIPNKGIGYGALRQTGKVGGALPKVIFNYLGQLGESNESGEARDWSLVAGYAGVEVAHDNEDDLALNINGAVQQGVLRLSVVSRLPQAQTDLFIADFEAALAAVISTATQQAQLGGLKTPSDYGVDKLSVAELSRLQNEYDIEAIYPATSLQQGFIYHHISQPDDDAYRVQMLFDYQRALDLERYQEAWRLASLRFPILRTAFDWQEEMLQVITRGASIDKDNFTVKDISHLSLEAREEAIIDIQQQDRAVGFDLTQPSLIRFTIIKQADDLFTVLKSEHHSVVDGWSLPVLMDTVHGYYNQLMAGEAPRIEVDKAYLATQQYYVDTQAETNAYWSEVKAKYQVTNDLSNLLTHKVDLTQVKSIDTPVEQALKFEGQAYKQLTTMCKTQGVTLNVALQFAWHKLLQTYSGDSQTIVGTTVSGRDVPVEGIESSVGLYINTLPLMVDWEQDELTVAASLKAIQKDIAALNSQSAVSLASLQQDGERLFHSLFVFENYPMPEVDEDNMGIESSLAFRQAVEKVDYPLTVIAYEQGDSLVVNLGFSEAWLSTQDAARLLNQLERILSSIASEPAQLCQSLSFISGDERNTLLHDFNDTDAPYPSDKTLHQLFDEQVSKTPDNIALVFEDKQLTYAELNEKANQLAHAIRQEYLDACGHELKADTLIPLYLDRSLEMVISILAVLKAGGAYVPISPEYPAERTQFILEDIAAKMVVTQSQHLGTLAALSDDIDHAISLLAADILSIYINMPTATPSSISIATDLAYVIYTSGTTGKPKGVMLAHDAVVNRIYWMQKEYPLAESDRVLQKTPYIFDVSVWELFWANQVGARIVIAAPELHKQPELLQALISDAGITTLHFVPSMLSCFSHYLKESLQQLSTRVNQVFCSGEALGVTHVEEFNQVSAPGSCLFNLYGPTEAAIDVSYFDTRDSFNASVPIGRGIDNIRLYILDEQQQLVPIGIVGELYIGGAGLARGYLNRPELTKECFIGNPFATESDIAKGYTRLYKTGDLVRYLPDGNLKYLGRNDSQVKIRGYRIELGEVETALSSLSYINQAVVVETKNNGISYLSAYLVGSETARMDNEKLRSELLKLIPEYMIPSYFIFIDKVPLTVNGKIAKNLLPEPAWSRDAYVAPRNDMEADLVLVWQEVLGVERIGVFESFFSLGGNSILAVKLISKIRSQLKLELSLSTLFKLRNISDISPEIKNKTDIVIKPISNPKSNVQNNTRTRI
ncbi:amino acid adenylation domain-containing protein [Shewanella baltica]|uniref:amino acid adenylation domain-containing protein n=1 Tax=Shewanella baltica TaxID=62322 RepID=UPI00325C40D2